MTENESEPLFKCEKCHDTGRYPVSDEPTEPAPQVRWTTCECRKPKLTRKEMPFLCLCGADRKVVRHTMWNGHMHITRHYRCSDCGTIYEPEARDGLAQLREAVRLADVMGQRIDELPGGIKEYDKWVYESYVINEPYLRRAHEAYRAHREGK